MRRLCPWLVLAACGSEGSLEILVTAPSDLGVQEVELYVGIHDDHDDAVRPKRGPLDPVVWWKRDPGQTPDQVVLEMVPGGVLYPFMAGGGDSDALASVVAVGYGAVNGELGPVGVASQLFWTDIPKDEIHRYELQLGAFEPLPRAEGATPTLPGLQVWGPPNGNPRECVQVDHVHELDDTDDYKPAVSAMIVTRDDPDCDGLLDEQTDVECFPREYMAQAAMKRDSLSCALPAAFAGSGGIALQACIAGGATCADGTGMDPTVCSPSAYCLPTEVCKRCVDPRDCDPYVYVPGTPYIECIMRTVAATGPESFCGGVTAHLDLQAQLSRYGLACDNDPSRGPKLRKGRQNTFKPNLTFIGSNSASATLTVTPSGGCGFDFQASGPVPLDGSNGAIGEFHATFAVPLIGPQENRGLMMPIFFKTGASANGCDAPDTVCKVYPVQFSDPMQVADAGLYACLHSPPAPGTIVVD